MITPFISKIVISVATSKNFPKIGTLRYKDLKWIETDDSLESIRGEQGYKEIVEQLKKGQ